MKLERERLAYLAGLFDGEGCVMFSRARARSPHLGGTVEAELTNTDIRLVQLCAAAFGGRIRSKGARTGNRRPAFDWSLYGANAAAFLEAVGPFLVAKREQAQLALKIRSVSPGLRGPMLVRLGALKRTDHGGRFSKVAQLQETRMKSVTIRIPNLNKIKTTRRFATPMAAQNAIRDYANGVSMQRIADNMGASVPAVRRLFTLNNVTVRGRGRYAMDQFQRA